MARVNMFLRMKCGQITTGKLEKIKSPQKMSSLIFEKNVIRRVNTFLDVTESWLPTEEDFALAQEDIQNNDLNFDFKNVEELYFNEGEKGGSGIEILYD